MIFNEIYGCYYHAVAKIIALAVDEKLTETKMREIASENAFEESFLTIVPALKNQEWQLIDHNLTTPVKNRPTMPMTILEKRWLKTILSDERVKLFEVPMDALADVEPLFEPEDIVYFDRYLDGDSYEDLSYVEHFRTIQSAIREHKKVKVKFYNGRGRETTRVIEPVRIEYSDKEDKFRVLCAEYWDIRTINIGRIVECTRLEEGFPADVCPSTRRKDTLIFELRDERRALERAMMKFAHYKKEVQRAGDNTYQVTLEYDVEDETDVLIQVLSFGSHVKIIAPDRMKEALCDRMRKQLNMLNW